VVDVWRMPCSLYIRQLTVGPNTKQIVGDRVDGGLLGTGLMVVLGTGLMVACWGQG
jgi:hypothetical protein